MHPHQLRHAFATSWLAEGGNENRRSELVRGSGVLERDLEGKLDGEQLQFGDRRHQGPPLVGGDEPDAARVDSHPSRSARYRVRSGSKSRVWPAPG
jgi:hypothetical protein